MIAREPNLTFVDLFCGAGGFTAGAEQSGYARGALAINHWRPAVYSHETNHPHVRHICASIDDVNPLEFKDEGINLLLASPECVYHSVARGGRPVDDQRRASAWCVPRWIESLRPKWVVIENVREFVDWAPLGRDNKPLKSKKGEIFRAWVAAIQACGYHVEWKLLNAADFGGATKRIRLFIVCRRGRSKKPIPWPTPTHAKADWTPAWKIIDWSRPCPSIFNRKRPLAEKTLRRIEQGLRKFCKPELVEPWLVHLRGQSAGNTMHGPTPTVTTSGAHLGVAMPFQLKAAGRCPGLTKSIDEPLPTVLGKDNHAIVVPFITQFHNGPDGANRNYSPGDPIPTLDTQNRYGVVQPFLIDTNWGENRDGRNRVHDVNQPLGTVTTQHGQGVVMPFMVDTNHGEGGRSAGGRVHDVDQPLGTITCGHGKGIVAPFLLPRQGHFDCQKDKPCKSIEEPLGTVTANHSPAHVVTPFLTTYYGTGQAQSVDEPITTLTTKHRHGLALVETMRELGIVDIGFRMLDVDELAAAQGFGKDYFLHGTKAERVKQIGNAVHTAVARALVEAIGQAEEK